MTLTEIKRTLAKQRLKGHYMPNLTRAMVKQSAQQMTDNEWDTIIAAIKTAQDSIVGKVLREQVLQSLYARALADVETRLADGSLSTAELLELF